ncbi:MAG TPA: hypothetical protein DCE52_03770 [Rhodobacteraceae bacterium]|nr:hypothetical protein [Paracoccaceae bacterium]
MSDFYKAFFFLVADSSSNIDGLVVRSLIISGKPYPLLQFVLFFFGLILNITHSLKFRTRKNTNIWPLALTLKKQEIAKKGQRKQFKDSKPPPLHFTCRGK